MVGVTVVFVVVVVTGVVVVFVATVAFVVRVVTGVTVMFVLVPKVQVVEVPSQEPVQLAPPKPVPPPTQ
jgi:hypothetical protein